MKLPSGHPARRYPGFLDEEELDNEQNIVYYDAEEGPEESRENTTAMYLKVALKILYKLFIRGAKATAQNPELRERLIKLVVALIKKLVSSGKYGTYAAAGAFLYQNAPAFLEHVTGRQQ